MTVGLWMVLGVGVGLAMGRRGYSLRKWLPIGIALGPLSIALALGVRADTAQREGSRRQLRPGEPGQGPVRVVVGIDGSKAADAALHAVVALLGPRLGHLTLASVCDLDTGVDGGTQSAVQARRQLERSADAVLPRKAELVVLSGSPAETLLDFARSAEADLVVVGSGETELSRRVLGSVARSLAAQARPAVLIVGRSVADARAGRVENPPPAASLG